MCVLVFHINFIDVCPGVSSHSTVEVSTATPEAALSQVEGQTQCHSSCLVLTSLHDSTTPNFVLLTGQSHEHQLDTGRSVRIGLECWDRWKF